MGLFISIIICFFAILVSYFVTENLKHPNVEQELYGWERNKSRNITDYIHAEEDDAIIKPINFCNTADHTTLIWIFVVSNGQNFNQRRIIRETWGNFASFNYSAFHKIHHETKNYLSIDEKWSEALKVQQPLVRIAFLVGKQNTKVDQLVLAESVEFKDILRVNVIEHYLNLTLKSLYILKYASSDCLNLTPFFVKTDDDVFVNIPNLVHTLLGGTIPLYCDLKYFYDLNTVQITNNMTRIVNYKRLLLGDIWNLTPALRISRFKHYSPYYMYEKIFYPPFLSGYAYVMSNEVAQKLYKTALQTQFFHLEDVFITGILAAKSGIRRRRCHLFSFRKLRSNCGLKGIIFENGREPENFYKAIEFLLNPNVHCSIMIEQNVKNVYKAMYYILEPYITMWNIYKFWIPPSN